jgi:hypothetical protein
MMMMTRRCPDNEAAFPLKSGDSCRPSRMYILIDKKDRRLIRRLTRVEVRMRERRDADLNSRSRERSYLCKNCTNKTARPPRLPITPVYPSTDQGYNILF